MYPGVLWLSTQLDRDLFCITSTGTTEAHLHYVTKNNLSFEMDFYECIRKTTMREHSQIFILQENYIFLNYQCFN